MKQRILTIISALVLLVATTPAVVYAVEGDSTQEASTTSTTQTTATKAELQTRLAARKAEFKTRLSTYQKLRLKGRCKASQVLLGTARQKATKAETKRTEVYNNVVTRLTALSAKVKEKGVDTTKLDAEIAELKTKITTFTTDVEVFQQAVADLVDMDCASDTEAFKATLESARTALGKVVADTAAIRSYIKDTIKPELQTIRTQLGKTGEAN